MKHNYHFQIVEHDGTRVIHSYLNFEVKPYTRNTAKVDYLKIYKKHKDKLNFEIENAPGRIYLTFNIWNQ